MRKFILVIVILVIAVVAYYLGQKSSKPELPTAPEQPVTERAALGTSTKQEPGRIKFPVNTTGPDGTDTGNAPVVSSLPGLDRSDQDVRAALAVLYKPQLLDNLFNFDSFIRHFVVTVDNMTARKLPQKYKVTRLPVDKFLVKKDVSGELYIDPANYNRYSPYIRVIESIDVNRLAGLYFRYYPLFQQAYQELGYPDRYFNDRLVEVIDHVLASPDVQGPVKLKQPVVYYTFADPELEKLSAGRKLMLRIGPENAAMVKSWLRRLRVELTKTGEE